MDRMMKNLLVGLAAMLLLALSACGGGGNAGTPVLGGGTNGANPTLTVELSTNTVTAAAPATVSAKLLAAGGAPMPGQVITFSTVNGLGSFSSTTALTDASGLATVTLQPKAATSTGADTVSASATVAGVEVTAAIGFQLTATNVTIARFAADATTIGAYGQTALTVTLAGSQPGTPVNIAVSSACVSKQLATLTPESVTTSTGTAIFTYRDAGCGSFDAIDGLQASVTGTSATATIQLTLTAPLASSVSFISATPPVIFLRGSGFVESSNVVFQVRDANGAGVPNRRVTLEPTTLAGGLLVDGGAVSVSKLTDSDGKVLVRVNAGTVPTPVRIRATLDGTAISTVSSNLSIAVGLPSQNNFSMSQGTKNIEGYSIDGTANTYMIIASDRLGNPVPDGTSINFVTEGGQVQAVRTTEVGADGLSRAVANFQSASPRSVDGRITVVAYALGEESFLDANGNNVYDLGEDYQDLGDVFIDRLYNGTYNLLEDQFISLTTGGTEACRVATSPLLQLDLSAPSRTITNTGAALNTCIGGWGRAYVRRAVQTVFSTSEARPMYGVSLPANATVPAVANCPRPLTLLKEIDGVDHGYTAADVPVMRNYYRFGSADLTGMPKTGVVFLIASDANPIAFNPMPAGTVVSVVGTKGLTSSVDGGSPVPSTVSPTGVAIGYGFDDTTDSGTITVTFTTPGKLSTAFSQFITQRTQGVACP